MRSVKLSKRVAGGPNAIRWMFKVASELDEHRVTKGLKPLISLGIGAPHIPANPVMDLAFKDWTDRKLKLKDQIAKLEEEVVQKDTKKQELRALVSTLTAMDTYQPSQGMEGVRKASAALINSYYPSLNATARHMCIANGATHAIFVTMQAFIEAGVAAAAFSPFFPPYQKQVEGLGGTWVTIPTGEDARPTPELLEEYLLKHPNIAVLIINDPCNPTGLKLTSQELKRMGDVLSKPEFSHIVILCDETYHDLVYTEDKSLFLHVNNTPEFRARTFIVLSMAKALGGCPGLRVGIVYAPDLVVNGKVEQMGIKLGTLMLDTTCAVSTSVQYATECVLKAKLGEGNPEWVRIHRIWEQSIVTAYCSSIEVAKRLFTADSGFKLVIPPSGAFFGFISAQNLIGHKIPHQVMLLDGRIVKNLPELVGSPIFETDIHVAMFLIHAAEVVTVPGSGFVFDTKKGYLRVSFALSPDVLEEAYMRMKNCATQVFTQS